MKCDTDGTDVNSPSPGLSVCVKNDDVIYYQLSREYLRNTGFREVVAVFIKDTLISLTYDVDIDGEKTSGAERVLADLRGVYGVPDKSGYFEYDGNLNKKYLAVFEKNLPKEGVFISSSLADARNMEKVDFIQVWNNASGVDTRVEFKASIFGKLLTVKSKLFGACERYPNHCDTIKSL